VAQFGDSNELQIGDYVMAMGSPFSLSRSVTLGIVSNSRRVFAGEVGGDLEGMELEAGQRTGMFTQWIQHDALIHPGNSGGPLVNLQGRIVGINELGGSSMGFAIPSNLARRITDELIENGEVVRSWIGVGLKSIEKTGYQEGVLVDSVVEDGPAGKAGLEAGDVIVALEGEEFTIRFTEEIPPLIDRIAGMEVGTSFDVEYLRGGERHHAAIVTERLERDLGEQKAFRSWGLTAMGITPRMAQERRLASTKGVLVTSVSDGGPAALAEPQIAAGVVLRRIDDTAIDDLKAFVEAYDRIMERDPLPEYLLVEYESLGKSQLTLMKAQPDEDEDRPREVPKPWLGVATQPVLKKLADQLGDEKYQGFRITRVYPRTLAAETELKTGDIIVGLEGKRIYPRGMHDAGLLSRVIRQMQVGQKVTINVLRDGKSHAVPVELENTRMEPSEARREKNRDFEMTVRELTFFDRDALQWGEEVEGVLIEQVTPAGWAALGGLAAGDLIQRIDDHVIESIEDFRAVMDAITEAEPQRVVFVVLRGSRTHYQFVEPQWRPTIENDDLKDTATQASPADEKEQNR
jgi:serine protease Do